MKKAKTALLNIKKLAIPPRLSLNVQNHLADDSQIAGVFDELDDELIKLISENQLTPKPLLICSGGTSSRCASQDHWTLDLRRKYNQIKIDTKNQEVEIGAGVKMGTLINELSKTGNSFPIGLSGATGMGYILSGGISPISRNKGLAIDQILQIKGLWGSGKKFELTQPKSLSSVDEKNLWRALNGAAPFLAIITNLKLKIQKINPIYIFQAILNPIQLAEFIYQAESWPKNASLQWIWGDQIKAFVVIEIDKSATLLEAKKLLRSLPISNLASSSIISGLQEMPRFCLPNNSNNSLFQTHSEVIGLLGERWGDKSLELIKSLDLMIKNRPNKGCYLASQQLGGATKNRASNESSFIHRNSIWKPWICGTWNKDDLNCRKNSLDWVEKVWNTMQPLCPGIHLAQMHQHLPWHSKELQKAFQDWLPELQNLKSRYDPNGILPPL